MKTRRTARKDSTFILYEVVASDGNNYIGLTRKGSTTVVTSRCGTMEKAQEPCS